MKVNKVKQAIISAFAAVFAFVASAVAATVAKIGNIEYATIDAAIDAWKEGDEIKLLCNIDIADYFVKTKNFVIDGCGYTLKCTKAHNGYNYFVNVSGYKQTFKNITIDGNKQVAYAVQCINTSSTLILDNVTLKGGKTTLLQGLMGYGLHINKGNVIANDLKVSDCDAAAVYIDSNKAAGGSFTLTGDNCDLDAVGVADGTTPSLSVTAKGFSVYDVSAKYSYSILIGTREGTKNLSNVISALSWNQAISEIQSKISGISVKVKSATVTLKGDVKFKEAFTSNESRLTVEGAGKTVTGKFIFNSSTPTTVKNIVLGNGSILDCTASTKTGFSSVSVAANTSIDILLPASTDINSYALPVSLGTDAVANIFVGDKKYIAKNGVISSAEKLAQIGDKQYATLQEAIDAANGAVVQVLKDVALTSSLTVPAGKTLTLNLAGRKVTISGANYALINNGNLTIVDMGLVSLVAAEATIGDEESTPIVIMAPSANDGVALIDDVTGGSIAGVQNNGTFALESGAVVAASASVPAIDNTANAVATITGGTVEGTLQAVDKTALTITGGSFTGESNVSEFVGGDYGVDSNGTIVKNVAKIGEVGYLTLEDAVAAAKSGDTVVVIGAIAGEAVVVDKDLTITGEVTLTDVSINGTAGKLTVSNLTFVGNSWINAGGCDELVVENVTANVAPSNASYTNSRDAFIGLGRNEGKQLKLTVTDCNIVVPSGSNAVLGWAAVTEVTISGNTFGSEASYQNNGDIVKFMAIADGAVINITNNTSYSNYNGFVFAQNTTRDNSYTVYVSGNTFYGGADHIWIEISGGDTVHAKVEATSDNTVNGNKFTVADIKYHYGVIKNWDGYAGVDVVTDANGKVIGGTLAYYDEDFVAEGYVVGSNGSVAQDPMYGKVAKIGDVGYATLSAAFAAVTDDAQTVTILKDVTENLTGAYLRGNITTENDAKVTITLTNSDWVYCPYTFVLGANVTLKCPALFYYAGGTQINGTLIVGAYYQMYAGTKLTINEPGSMTVTTEQFYLRYTDGDANAGIYINGDNDDSTIGLNTSVIYFYQGMINAKNANIKTSVYWQTNETDSQGSANLMLDNSKLNITSYENVSKATGNSTVTLKNGSQIIAVLGFEGNALLSIDITGMSEGEINVIQGNLSNFTGKLETVGNDNLEASIVNGKIVLSANTVAKIGETTYATLADALAAAQAGDTVVLLAEATGDVTVAEGCEVIIDLNGNDIVGTLNAIVNNGTLTINDTVGTGNVYTTDVSAQGRAAIVNRGTIVINGGWFGDANNDTSDRNAINRGNALKNYGTAIVNGGYFTNVSNQYIGSDAYAYAINTLAGGTTVINEATVYGDINGLIYSDGKTTVNGGSFTLGRPGEENNLWYLAYGDVVIKGGTWARAFKVPSWNTSDPKFNGNVVVSGGDFNIEIPETYRAEGYQSVKQPGKDLWQVGKLPNAEVINVGPYTVDEESYYIYNITNKSFTSGHKDEFDLQVTLGFIANDTVEEAAANAYGQYLTDFRIKIEGIENGSFVADKDCYLAGYYPFFGGWVKVNLDGMTIENNVGYPVITGVTEMPFTYETICDIVKSFICGIHLSDEVLQANPNLKVSLELGLAETQEKMLDGTGFVTVGDTYDYTVEELTSAVALTGSDYYTTVDDAVAAALETGDFVKLVNDASLKGNLEFGKKFVLDLGGKTLAADGKTLLIDNSYVVMTNGTLSGFTAGNVTLVGNAILTVTDKNVADGFRLSGEHYVSQNMNGTYSIMLKSAFRVYITMVDGEPRIGFFQDCAQGAVACTLLGATSLENADWTNVVYTPTDDASGASELPLYWVKLNQGADDANVYRFFKIGE